MKKVIFTLAFLIFVVIRIFASSAGTFFQMYVPPNAENPARISCIIITALNDSTFVELVDDNMDADTDDSFNGLLMKGQSYIRYIKDGSVNDDIGGKQDGDYFLIYSNKPVVVSQSTNSDWQHDWVPADNGKMKGNLFFIYSPQTSTSMRDLDIFAYEDSSFVQIYDITVTPQTTSGIASVNIPNATLVMSRFLSPKQDIINIFTNGRDILVPGKSYMIQTTKPVTVLYGSLWQNARDGGGYVPGIKGSTVDSFFYFWIPADYHKEQELRIINFVNGANITLDVLSNNNWSNIRTFNNVGANQHQDWVAATNEKFPLFRVGVSSGKIAMFEANWLETGGPGTSDIYSFCSSENGEGAGNHYLIYLAPPGKEGNCLDPFTNKRFSQIATDGLFSHCFIYSHYANNSVRIYDTDGNGSVFDTTVIIQENKYFDIKVWKTRYDLMILNGKRPYITVVSTLPVSTATTNWNDNWMCFASSSVKTEVLINNIPCRPAVQSGDTTVFSSVVKNVSGGNMNGTKTEVVVEDGLNIINSNLTSSSQGNLGSGNKTEKPNGEEVVKWQNYQFNNGDSMTVKVVVKVDSIFASGNPVPNNTNLTGTTTSTGLVNGDTVVTQNTSATMAQNTNLSSFVYKYLAAFEDLKNDSWNDWDINDFVCSIERNITVTNTNKIKSVEFDYEALARGARYDHQFLQNIKLNGTSTVSLAVKDSNGNIIQNLSWGPNQKIGEFTVSIFGSTKQALPPWNGLLSTNTDRNQVGVVKGYTAKLTIIVDSNANNLSSWLNSSADPYIVNDKGQTVHIANIAGTAGNTQNIDNSVIQNELLYGYYLDLAYKMPFNWKWPLETGTNVIWKSYPKFDDYIISGKMNELDWYSFPDTTRTWNRRNVIITEPLVSGANINLTAIDKGIYKYKPLLTMDTIGKICGSPKLADINGDGYKEILIGTLEQKFHALDRNGQNLPGFPINTSGIVKSTAGIDISNNNAKIFFGTDDGRLYGIDKNGQNISGFPISIGGTIKCSPVVSDINADGINEIIVAAGDGKMYVYKNNGTILSGFPKKVQNSVDTYGYLIIQPSPAVVDLDKNGTKEIVFASFDSSITVIDYHGNVKPGFPVRLNNIIYSSPLVIKYDDGNIKFVAATGSGTIYLINSSGQIESSIQLQDGFISSPVPVDIDNDGVLELFAAAQNGTVYLLNMNNGLSIKWSHITVSELCSSPVVADINDDGFYEIIIGAMNGTCYVFDKFGSMDNVSMSGIAQFSSWIFSSPAISDINNNGKPDLVIGSYDRTLKVFELPSTGNNAKIYWSSFGNDLGNTRLAGVPDSVTSIADGLGKVYNYFNPVKEENTTFRVEAPANTEKLTLKLFDLGGEMVFEISKDNFSLNGIYWEYIWDLKNSKGKAVANGAYIYFVEITVNGKTYSKTQKLAVLR